MRVERDVLEAAREVASESGIEAAVLLAVALVETQARAFTRVEGRREPLIRFEGHYFDRLLDGPERLRAREAGLASPEAGAVRNPASQAARWRLLDRAAEIDREAAFASTSWGLGQVMGAHWRRLGYASATALAEEARESAAGQLRIVAKFLQLGGLGARLASGDFAGFARAYNGPAYERNRYDRKIEAAFEEAQVLLEGGARPPAVIAAGDSGEDVRAVQAALVRHGASLAVDAIFGPRTEQAVRAFQRERGLAVSGVVDAATRRALPGPARPNDGLAAKESGGWFSAPGLLFQPASWLMNLLRSIRALRRFFSTSTERW